MNVTSGGITEARLVLPPKVSWTLNALLSLFSPETRISFPQDERGMSDPEKLCHPGGVYQCSGIRCTNTIRTARRACVQYPSREIRWNMPPHVSTMPCDPGWIPENAANECSTLIIPLWRYSALRAVWHTRVRNGRAAVIVTLSDGRGKKDCTVRFTPKTAVTLIHAIAAHGSLGHLRSSSVLGRVNLA